MSDATVEFLKKVAAFSGVSEQGLELLSRICRPVEMKAGDVIIKEGDEGDCVYIIEQGQVEITMSITLGPRLWEEEASAMDKVLVKLGSGAMFGEMAFIFKSDKRSATIVALSEGKLLSITSGDFQRFSEEDLKSAHRILLNIAKIIAERLRKTNQDVKKLTTALSIALRRPRKP
jgi:CRP/FNR family cyclic AMP-dependent transcriptional regulator